MQGNEYIHTTYQCTWQDNIYMVMGLIKGGDLWAVIHREDAGGEWISGFSEAQAKFYTLILADTLVRGPSRKLLSTVRMGSLECVCRTFCIAEKLHSET